MANKTGIEWTDRSSNPIKARRRSDGKRGWHCTKVSQGCAHCYAERMNIWRGTGLTFSHTSKSQLDIVLDEKELERLKRLKGEQRVFICDMTDLFGEHVPDWMVLRIIDVMRRLPHITFQVLTKRAARLCQVMTDLGRIWHDSAWKDTPWPIPNLWLGVSVEDQAAADERIPLLLQTPASVRFLSCEPLLGPVDVISRLDPGRCDCDVCTRTSTLCTASQHPLDWVIVGGESGAGARPFNVAWAQRLIEQCRAAGVACFVKQLGAKPYQVQQGGKLDGAKVPLKLSDRKGGNWHEWPEGVRVRQFPAREAA